MPAESPAGPPMTPHAETPGAGVDVGDVGDV